MAVYVLLSFDKDQDAKDFVKKMIDNIEPVVVDQAEVRGVWQKPTMFCKSGDGHRGKKTEAGWTRGRKYGWWVCGKCGKPTDLWGRGGSWESTLGTNLLPQELLPTDCIPSRYKTPSPMEWTWLLEDKQNTEGG